MGNEKRQFVNFYFLKLDPAYRRLPAQEQETGKREFLAAVEEFSSKVMVVPYSTVGIRAEVDIMLWRISYELESFQDMTVKMLSTGLGKYMNVPYSYLAMTKRSTYVDKHTHEGQESKRLTIVPGEAKYLFIYPFVKTREWYLLTKAARQGMMNEHIRIGHEFPTVRQVLVYSTGLDDQEFIVSYETDDLESFQQLVIALRDTEARRYTLRDTPIFTCVYRPLPETLGLLG